MGSTSYFNSLVACVCKAGLCKTACGGSGDYCTNPPNVATQGCNTCLNQYFAVGAACDSSPGTAIGNGCAADSECTGYLNCANGCPP